MKLFDIPPVWLSLFCLIAWFMARELPYALITSRELQILGSLLSILGLMLIAWSAITFSRAKTTIEPHATPTALITTGPFRWSRNPIYLAMVLILAGWVLWLGAVSAVILPGIFVALISLRFIMPEEALLQELFGEAAERYFARTRRWI